MKRKVRPSAKELDAQFKAIEDWAKMAPPGFRDNVAAQCLQGILSAGGYNQKTGVTHFIPVRLAAKKAVEYTDALMEALALT